MIQVEKAIEVTREVANRAAARAALAVVELVVFEDQARVSGSPPSYVNWLSCEHGRRIERLIEETMDVLETNLGNDIAGYAGPAAAELIEYVDHALRAALAGEADVASPLTWWPTMQEPFSCNVACAVRERMWLLTRELCEVACDDTPPSLQKGA